MNARTSVSTLALTGVFLGLLAAAPSSAQDAGSIAAWGEQVTVPPGALSGLIAISAGYSHGLALRGDGRVVAWGSNNDRYGTLYEGECDVPAPNSDLVAVAAGAIHSVGLRRNGTVVNWGAYGPLEITSPHRDFVAIAAGYWHVLGLTSNGSVVAYGHNGNWAGQTTNQCVVPAPNSVLWRWRPAASTAWR